MAKLSARGRREVARFVREADTPDNTLIRKEKTTFALMSDGALLFNRTVWFIQGPQKPHTYGWKIHKPKGALLGEDGKVSLERLEPILTKLGYVRT